ncbi:MAG TPA: hypothetical protein VKX25_08300 [Bryobacteraceae bacterium]|jgi:hypothetical protein|nr:hypothetical protein [Bryobacteraceae bacterium]
MAYPNGQEHSNEPEADVFGGEPLADSGFENENPESNFGEGTEE